MYFYTPCMLNIDQSPRVSSLGLPVAGKNLLITGVSISWEDRDAYFISFTRENMEGMFLVLDEYKIRHNSHLHGINKLS